MPNYLLFAKSLFLIQSIPIRAHPATVVNNNYKWRNYNYKCWCFFDSGNTSPYLYSVIKMNKEIVYVKY
jgi:hypothetical protein